MNQVWTPQFSQNDVTVVKENVSYPGYCQVKTFQLNIPFFEGNRSDTITRDVVVRPSAVAVLLYDPDNDLVMLIEQFRPGVYALTLRDSEARNPWILEIVAGVVESNHSVLETALREIAEEAEQNVLSLEPICTYYASPGISTEQTHIYYGRFRYTAGDPLHYQPKYTGLKHEGEDIKVHLFSAETLIQFLRTGQILSASTLIAIQWLALNRDVLRSQR